MEYFVSCGARRPLVQQQKEIRGGRLLSLGEKGWGGVCTWGSSGSSAREEQPPFSDEIFLYIICSSITSKMVG